MDAAFQLVSSGSSSSRFGCKAGVEAFAVFDERRCAIRENMWMIYLFRADNLATDDYGVSDEDFAGVRVIARTTVDRHGHCVERRRARSLRRVWL